MKKAALLSMLVAMVLLAVGGAVVQAQEAGKVPRIGYLGSGRDPDRIEFFRQGLRELGYIEGKNVHIEYRLYRHNRKLIRKFAAELVHLNVDVIFVYGTRGVRAVKKATTSIPVVSVSGDPVRNKFVASLARPGGNITGLANLTPELAGKRLELLREVIPKISLVGLIWNPDSPGARLRMRDAQAAAHSLGIEILSLEARGLKELDSAFAAIKNEKAGGLVPLRGGIGRLHKRIIELGTRDHVPIVYDNRPLAEAGALMSYGTFIFDLDRRAATYVDKILKGRKPSELPVQQPTKFEFIVNLKTAKQIGVTIPPNVLVRANRVIR